MPHTIIQPEGWAPAKGYANGVLTPSGILHIGGQIGWDANKEFVGDGFIEQMEQALKNIRAIVEAAGGTVEDIVRLTWFVTDKAEYMAHQREVGEAYRRVLGKHFPAMSMLVVSELVEDRAKVEIEATAELSKAD
ncbi:RidA family protein [Pararhodobacter marinus]|uniref:RidA family protein n=1 Tax=Pararhodobacter marinus TaxID=2184063 RepID=UPI0035189562